MRTVYHAEGIVDAHLVKDALAQAGIPAFVNGEYLIGGVGQLPARDFLTVSVPDPCVEAAAPVVRDIVDMLRAPLAAEPAEGGVPGAAPAAAPARKPLRPWRVKPTPA
ncbi:MAG: DUF2007 domain-containing protein [Rhodanobacteraceae bacterium]|nr:MAG: DUF2007 domain-containing protein [Rhodanobacteraceae bacterium]